MPSFFEGQAMESHHHPPSLSDNGHLPPTSSALRQHLHSLVEDKGKQLQLVGSLGQRFLSQQVELEERLAQMDEAEHTASTSGHVDKSMDLRRRLEDLAHTMQTWEAENQQMWTALTIGSGVSRATPYKTYN